MNKSRVYGPVTDDLPRTDSYRSACEGGLMSRNNPKHERYKVMIEHDHYIVWLILLGVAIALGKLLSGSEPLTWRLVAGRLLLGAATTMIAGAAVMQIPDLPLIAILGIGAALGVGGAQLVEKILLGWGSKGGGG